MVRETRQPAPRSRGPGLVDEPLPLLALPPWSLPTVVTYPALCTAGHDRPGKVTIPKRGRVPPDRRPSGEMDPQALTTRTLLPRPWPGTRAQESVPLLGLGDQEIYRPKCFSGELSFELSCN